MSKAKKGSWQMTDRSEAPRPKTMREAAGNYVGEHLFVRENGRLAWLRSVKVNVSTKSREFETQTTIGVGRGGPDSVLCVGLR
jgi:hypothetical protein